MPIYLQYGSIKGDATQENHKQWMDISSIHWNVSRNMNTLAGSAANREASEPAVSEVTLTKVSDSSSVRLFQEACTGNKGQSAVIHLVTTGNPGETYIEYTLDNALIASYSVDSNGDRPMEHIRINFTKMQVKYIPRKEDNSGEGQQVAAYDLAPGKMV